MCFCPSIMGEQQYIGYWIYSIGFLVTHNDTGRLREDSWMGKMDLRSPGLKIERLGAVRGAVKKHRKKWDFVPLSVTQ